MSVNLVKLAIKCVCHVFIFENKKRTGYDKNIAKQNYFVTPFRMARLMNQKRIYNPVKHYQGMSITDAKLNSKYASVNITLH